MKLGPEGWKESFEEVDRIKLGFEENEEEGEEEEEGDDEGEEEAEEEEDVSPKKKQKRS